MKEIITTTQIIEDGKIINEQIERKVLGYDNSEWVFMTFDSQCVAWTKDSQYNLAYLRHRQRYLTDVLMYKGYITENDIRDALGIARTARGQINGLDYTKGDILDFGLDRYAKLSIDDLKKVDHFELRIKIRENIFNLPL